MGGVYIHLFECPECDNAQTRADRVVPCFKCGTEMELSKRQIATIQG